MKEEYKKLIAEVSDNPAAVKYPMDRWGITSDLRKAITKAVGNIRGSEFKQEMIEATLYIALAHIKKRADKDKALAAKRVADIKKAAQARVPMERIQASIPVKKEAA